jgi:hypothetical protein
MNDARSVVQQVNVELRFRRSRTRGIPVSTDKQPWRKLMPLLLGLDLLACQPPAPAANPAPSSTPSAEAAFVQGNTARENKDYTEAMRLYRQAAAAGNASAMNNIGQLYQHGWGVPSDNGEALRWYRQSAERGNLAAINNIGSLYQKGLGVAADYGEAMRWCHQAADRGYATAMGNIGFSRKRG